MGYKRFGSSPDRLKMKRLIPLGSLCTVWCGHLGRYHHATPHTIIRLLLEADCVQLLLDYDTDKHSRSSSQTGMADCLFISH